MDITNYHNTYLQYQQLATTFTTWLFDAAKRSGVEVTYLAPTHGNLPLSECQRLAAGIVANGTVVPAAARNDLAQIITIRNEVCASARALLFKDKAICAKPPAKSRASPLTIAILDSPLNTLRTIRHILDPETRIEQAMTALSLLSLTDLATTLMASPIPKKPTATTGAQRKKAKKLQHHLLPSPAMSPEEFDQETLFAWLAFFHDVGALRAYISDLWSRYAAGRVLLTHAAMLTNTAIDMLRHLTVTYLDIAPDPLESSGAPHICPWLFEELSALLETYGGRGGDISKPASWSPAQQALADWTSYHTRARLVLRRSVFTTNVREQTVFFTFAPLETDSTEQAEFTAELHQCMYGVWDEDRSVEPSEDHADGSIQAARLGHWDDYWVREMYMELHHLSILKGDLSSDYLMRLDGLTGRWGQAIDYSKPAGAAVPLDLTLAFQVVFDLRQVLRSRIDRAFAELNAVSDKKIVMMQQYFQCRRAARKGWTGGEKEEEEVWKKLDGAALELVQDTRQHLKEDAIFNDMEAFARLTGVTEPGEKLADKPFFLLKNHPILCGMLAWREQGSRRMFQTMVARCSREVLHAAHLYNAMKLRGGVGNWPDMEFLLGTTSGEEIFLNRGRPSTIAGAIRLWAVAKNRTPKLALLGLGAPARVHEPFWGYGWALFAGEDWVNQPADQRLTQVLESVNEKTARAWMEGTGQNSLTGPQVLELIRMDLEKEEEALHWDYVSMVTRCRDMIGAVHESCVMMEENGKQGKQATQHVPKSRPKQATTKTAY